MPAKRGRKRGSAKPSASDAAIEKKARLTCVEHESHYKVGGHVLTLGEGDTGQLGLGPDTNERAKPAKVELPKKCVQIVAGGMHSVCLTEDGEVFTWGCNDEGALGRKTDDEDECFVPAKVELGEPIVQVCAGDSHSAALTQKGTVLAWGTFRDANGSLGLTPSGEKSEKPQELVPDTVVVKIVSGTDHLVCLTNTGTLLSLGCADQGQLGRVAEMFSVRGGRKGLDLLLKPAQVYCRKRNTKFSDVWTGQYATYARATTGEVYAWGLNNYYQLGLSDSERRYVPECIRCLSKSEEWKQISGGQHHALALDGKGKVYAFGRSEYRRLGLGEQVTDEVKEPRIVSELSEKNCVRINCGTCVSFAVTDEGEVYAWGMGSTRQLGQKDSEDDLWVPTRLTGKQLENRKSIDVSAGGQHTMILATD